MSKGQFRKIEAQSAPINEYIAGGKEIWLGYCVLAEHYAFY
jgi:hypothetical protein